MTMTFSRRAFLRSAALAAAASAIPVALRSQAAAQEAPALGNPGFYRFKVGNLQMTSLSDGVLNAPAAAFAGNATPEQLAEVLRQGFQSETLTPHCNILLVDTGSSKVLIDSGSGGLAGPTAGKLLTQLQTLQLSPADIDAVIITHAHSDHVGGLLDANGALIFPNARYFVSQPEYDFWTDPQVNLPRVKLDDATKQGFIQVAQKHLEAVSERMTRFAMGSEILPGISAIPAPGHTPGHVALQIASANASLIHTADTVHIHTINLWHPDWQPIFDVDPEQAAATRQQLLSQIAQERRLMFAYHFPFPGVGHIRPRSGGGFAWEPVSWQLSGE